MILNDLKDNHSLAFMSPMLVNAPGDREHYISPKDYHIGLSHDFLYNIQNDILVFVINGILYITPYTKNKEFCLLGSGFLKNRHLPIPFKSGLPCVEPEKSKWQRLCEE